MTGKYYGNDGGRDVRRYLCFGSALTTRTRYANVISASSSSICRHLDASFSVIGHLPPPDIGLPSHLPTLVMVTVESYMQGCCLGLLLGLRRLGLGLLP